VNFAFDEETTSSDHSYCSLQKSRPCKQPLRPKTGIKVIQIEDIRWVCREYQNRALLLSFGMGHDDGKEKADAMMH